MSTQNCAIKQNQKGGCSRVFAEGLFKNSQIEFKICNEGLTFVTFFNI